MKQEVFLGEVALELHVLYDATDRIFGLGNSNNNNEPHHHITYLLFLNQENVGFPIGTRSIA